MPARCRNCNWLMESIKFKGNIMNRAEGHNDYYMMIADDEQIRGYKFWECGNCGLLEMYRDHSKDKKVEHTMAETIKLYREGLRSERTVTIPNPSPTVPKETPNTQNAQ